MDQWLPNRWSARSVYLVLTTDIFMHQVHGHSQGAEFALEQYSFPSNKYIERLLCATNYLECWANKGVRVIPSWSSGRRTRLANKGGTAQPGERINRREKCFPGAWGAEMVMGLRGTRGRPHSISAWKPGAGEVTKKRGRYSQTGRHGVKCINDLYI